MTITERVKLKKSGIEVLRPMFNIRKNMWKIMKCTINSGWSRFGANWYFTKDIAQVAITALAQSYPKNYKSDD